MSLESRKPTAVHLAPALCLLAPAIALVVTVLFLRNHPDAVSEHYLFFEPGLNLLLVDQLLDGRRLYEDISIPYGVWPTMTHTGLAAVFGNSIATFLGYQVGTSVLSLALAWIFLRKSVSAATATVVTVFGLIPALIAPGVFSTGMENTYTTFERCWFLMILCCWKAPAARTKAGSLALGLLVGCAQYIKFGSGPYLLLSMAIVEVFILISGGGLRALWSRPALNLGLLFLGAAVAEGSRDILALCTLSRPVAFDLIWPGYAREHYQHLNSTRGPEEFFHFMSLKHLVVRQLTTFAGIALGLAGIVAFWWDSRRASSAQSPASSTALGPAIPLIFFLVGFTGYIGHIFIVIKYSWCAIIASALLLDRLGWKGSVGYTLLAAPAFFVTMMVPMAPRVQPYKLPYPLPNGEVVYLATELGHEVDSIRENLREHVGGPPVTTRFIGVPITSGFQHFLGYPPITRHVFHIPKYVRPYDFSALESTFRTADAILHDDSPLEDVFDPRLIEILRSRTTRTINYPSGMRLDLLDRSGRP